MRCDGMENEVHFNFYFHGSLYETAPKPLRVWANPQCRQQQACSHEILKFTKVCHFKDFSTYKSNHHSNGQRPKSDYLLLILRSSVYSPAHMHAYLMRWRKKKFRNMLDIHFYTRKSVRTRKAGRVKRVSRLMRSDLVVELWASPPTRALSTLLIWAVSFNIHEVAKLANPTSRKIVY